MALTRIAPGLTVDAGNADRFAALLGELRRAGITVDPTQSGGYNPRNIRGTSIPSMHASGAAVDINSRDNPEGARADIAEGARRLLERDMGGTLEPTTILHPDVARDIASRLGLRWGGDFRGRSPDPMHFEVAPGGGAPVPTMTASAPAATAAPSTTQAAPGVPSISSIVGGVLGEQGQQPTGPNPHEQLAQAAMFEAAQPDTPMQIPGLMPMAFPMAPRRPVNMAQLQAALAPRRLGG